MNKLMTQIGKVCYGLIDIYFIAISYLKFKNQSQNKSLLIVKVDAIGDYILFRNYLEDIRNSNKFKWYEITLCGNQVYQKIAETFDSKFIDKFIWIDKVRFMHDIVYRVKTLQQIRTCSYEYVIQPTFLRELLTGDSIVRSSRAKYKICSIGDPNLSQKRKIINNVSHCISHTHLILAKDQTIFEFLRNKEFFENLLSCKLFTKLKLPTTNLIKQPLNSAHEYVVCFIGASKVACKWSTDKFIQVAKFLTQYYKLDVIICGGPDDAFTFHETNPKISNLVGKTSILELINIIYNAKFVVSNETSIPHIASALEIPVFVISNGNDIGKFHPYPKIINPKYWIVYPDVIEQHKNELEDCAKKYQGGFNVQDINTINVNSVIQQITNNFQHL